MKTTDLKLWLDRICRFFSRFNRVRKMKKIRNRYNQAPHLTQDIKSTTSQLEITHKSQEVSRFPAGDHKASINRRKHNKNKTEITYILNKAYLVIIFISCCHLSHYYMRAIFPIASQLSDLSLLVPCDDTFS